MKQADSPVKVLYCGICATDLDGLQGKYGEFSSSKPTVCGHEVIGEVVKAGDKSGRKVGEIVGIGFQSDSCRECGACKSHHEDCCPQLVSTIAGPYQREPVKGERAYGGFAKYWRGPGQFAIPLPKDLDPSIAGPLFCGGITVFTPLKKWSAGKERKRVGVIGIGGLGHMAVQFASAMGAEVTAISRSDRKKADAEKLGARAGFIATGDDTEKACKEHEGSLDLVICTINPSSLPVEAYLQLLAPEGVFVIVGIPKDNLDFQGTSLVIKNAALAGSHIGSPDGITDMLKFAAEKNVKPWVQKYNMDDINKALKDFNDGKPEFRFVLVNTDNGGKM